MRKQTLAISRKQLGFLFNVVLFLHILINFKGAARCSQH